MTKPEFHETTLSRLQQLEIRITIKLRSEKGKTFQRGAIVGAFTAFILIVLLQLDLYRGELLASGYLIFPLILGALGLLFGGIFGVLLGKLSSLIWKKEAASKIGSWIGGFIGGILLTLLSLILVGTALIGAQ